MIVAQIGTTAGVRTGAGEKDFASAHDLRRAFGVRWSKRVMPAVLCKLMRHASMQTTMDFYNVEDAEQTADAVWDAFANTRANSAPKPANQDEGAIDASSSETKV